MYLTKKQAFVPFTLLCVIGIICLFFGQNPIKIPDVPGLNDVDTAWMLTATAFVFLMTPGLAFFYGGMVNSKNVISTMLQSFVCMAVVTVIWLVVGFSLSFGTSIHGIIGDPSTFFLMNHVLDGKPWPLAPTIPLILFALFQMKFAIITPALITGAFAERIRFSSYLLFICFFILFIYCPLAHAIWHPDGFLAKLGVLDFAGGAVVHMSAGIAALVSAVYLKKRRELTHNPARVNFILLGTGLLWVGWFGFNGGCSLAANTLAATAIATTAAASAAAACMWITLEVIRGKKPSATGFCIGAVVGLATITPAAGYVSIPHAVVIGLMATFVSSIVVAWRERTSIDDTLDVFPCHGVGGIVGMILAGVFANRAINPANTTGNGLFFGETKLFLVQTLAVIGIAIAIALMSYILLKITDMITPLRVNKEEEAEGLDLSQHGERL